MKEKSLKLNMVLNAVRGLISVLFPLITFPYVSKVLGVNQLGSYDFAASVISYISMLAALGISTYAIREGARVRDDRRKLNEFVNEIFTFNIISTAVAYVVFLGVWAFVPRFQEYRSLLLVLSFQVFLKTIGIEWFYSIYEDYIYITIRSILVHIFSLVLLYLLVHGPEDINVYAAITVFSAGGAYLINFWHARKYLKVGLTKSINWKKHFKPVMVLFAMSATISIYVNSDKTILGFLCGEYTVGIYAVSTKVYLVVKNILSYVFAVSIPRLSAILGRSDSTEYNRVATDIYKTMCSLTIPAAVGMICLRKEIVRIISDVSYMEATSSFSILSVALVFCMLAWFWGQSILIPQKREMDVFKATVASAIINVVLNIILIPMYKENAAAFTTMLSQAIAFLWCWLVARRDVKIEGISLTLVKVGIGCLGILACSIMLSPIREHIVIYTILTVLISTIIYFIIEILLKNEAITGFALSLKRKLIK